MKDPLLYSGQFARGDLSSWIYKNKVPGRETSVIKDIRYLFQKYQIFPSLIVSA